jgi:hypothetical protein
LDDDVSVLIGQGNLKGKWGGYNTSGKGGIHTKAFFESQMICVMDEDNRVSVFDLSCLPAEEIAALVAARLPVTTTTVSTTTLMPTR